MIEYSKKNFTKSLVWKQALFLIEMLHKYRVSVNEFDFIDNFSLKFEYIILI
jgi:hypothetical protein